MFKKLVLGILSTLILTTNVLANEIETKKVISTGVGLTESEALKDTTRNAVQQVVGAYILSDTYVKNSQLIKDEILTNSNGFVKGFKIISQTKDDTGLIKIEAEVEVEPSNVTKRLGELNIALKEVGTTELKAISLDKFQSSNDFKKMFNEIILKPLKDNKQIYEIKISELQPLEDFSADTQNITKMYWIENQKELYQKGDLLPFRLSFFISLNKNYLNQAKEFFDKSSKNLNVNWTDEMRGGNYITFKKLYLSPEYINSGSTITEDEAFKITSSYEFSSSNFKALSKMYEEFGQLYKPMMIISLMDNNKKQYRKAVIYDNYNSFKPDGENSSPLSDITISNLVKFTDTRIVDLEYPSQEIVTGLSRYNYISFLEESSNIDLIMLLSQEDIKKLKNISIELKWVKNN